MTILPYNQHQVWPPPKKNGGSGGTHLKNLSFERVPTLWRKNGVSFLTLITFELSRLGIANIFCPRYAIISLVADSESHKPIRNENNSCGVTQQHNKLLSNGPVLSIMVHKQLRICLGVDGPLTKAKM